MYTDHIQKIFFLGIGGIGMSALARHYRRRGVTVCGYDQTRSPLTRTLEKEGISVIYEDDPAQISSPPGMVIYTPAIPVTNNLYQHFRSTGIKMLKRAEVLGLLSEQIATIAVAGTHGKTTISTMLTHIMRHAGIPCLAFLGGISSNYGTNYISDPDPRWLIAEADEYDRSFLHLAPAIALISSVDNDHLDVYGSRENLLKSFVDFAGKLNDKGILVAKNSIAGKIGYDGERYSYNSKPPATYYLEHVRIEDGCYMANIDGGFRIEGIKMRHPGRHNLENALAAAVLAHHAGVGADDIRAGINTFSGVKRRFEIILKTKGNIFIDDYAHHPEEINACIQSAREMWPGKTITGVFQPHLYSRTRDLAEPFAESLSNLDRLILLPIYPARENPIEGVDAQMLLDKIKIQDAKICTGDQLVNALGEMKTEVLITMGAGNIDSFADDIRKMLIKKVHS